MYFPKLNLPLTSVLNYIQQSGFKELLFQFNLSQAYGAEIATLICYAMNTSGTNMNETAINLGKSFESVEYSPPLNLGNLVLSSKVLLQILAENSNTEPEHIVIILEPFKDDLNYICCEISVEVNKVIILRPPPINPCPPRCN